jgi:hypothetical protein
MQPFCCLCCDSHNDVFGAEREAQALEPEDLSSNSQLLHLPAMWPCVSYVPPQACVLSAEGHSCRASPLML